MKTKKVFNDWPFRMTVKQLKNAMMMHRFIIVRYSDGDLVGINSAILKVKGGKMDAADDKKTNIISYYPCSFQDYISHKTTFL